MRAGRQARIIHSRRPTPATTRAASASRTRRTPDSIPGRTAANPYPLVAMRDDPVVIGGTGGSGTRVVARMLRTAGVFMGGRLNSADDALDLAEFDWTWGLDLLRDGATDEMRAA